MSLRRIDSTDLKWEYQKRADELVLEEYGEDIEFYDLLEKDQERIYKKAMEFVDEEIQDQADMRRKIDGKREKIS